MLCSDLTSVNTPSKYDQFPDKPQAVFDCSFFLVETLVRRCEWEKEQWGFLNQTFLVSILMLKIRREFYSSQRSRREQFLHSQDRIWETTIDLSHPSPLNRKVLSRISFGAQHLHSVWNLGTPSSPMGIGIACESHIPTHLPSFTLVCLHLEPSLALITSLYFLKRHEKVDDSDSWKARMSIHVATRRLQFVIIC